MPFLPRRLNSRIILIVSCILLATGGASGWMSARDQAAGLLAAMRLNSLIMVRNFADGCARYLLVQDYAGLESYLLKSAELPDVRRLQVAEPNGALIWNIERGPDGQAQARTGIARVTPPPGLAAAIATDNDSLVVWQPIEAGNLLGWLRADFSLTHIREAQLRTWENTLFLTLAWVLSGALLIILILRPTVRSIGKLTAFAKQLDERKGAQIAIGRQPLEIDELGKSLNEASTQLLSTEQQLLHDRERLRESEEKFRQVSASAQDAIIILDQDGAVTDWNAAAEKIFGYAAAEAVGMDLHARLAPPRQRGAAAQGLCQFRDSGTGPVINKTLELAALRRDGTEFPIELSISSAMLRGRWHAIGVVRDISERKRAEQAALGQFKLAEAFFSHSVSGLVILDRNFNFVRVNEAYARAARREIGEFAGRNHFDMYPSDAQAIFEEVVRSKHPYTTFTRAFVYPDQPERGTTYWDWTLAPVLDAQGEVEYLVFSLQEVTERKRAEEVQRAAALYARSLIEANLDPLVTISAEGKITDVNKATEEVTGLARNRLVGTDFADYFTEPEEARAGYREVLARGYVRDYPLSIRHISGRTTDVLYNASVYRNEAGELQGVFAAARDITERKRAQEALRDSEDSLKEAQRIARVGNWELDHLGNALTWSDEIYRIFEIDPREFGASYDAFLDLIHPEDRERVGRAYTESVKSRIPYNIEHRLLMKDGRVKYVSERCETAYDPSGQPLRSIGTVQDITAQKQAEEEHLAHLRFLECTDQVNRAIQGTNDLEKMLSEVLDAVLSIFDCDRAWLVYPCDPESASWSVPMERTKPEYPGANVRGLEIPMDAELQRVFRTLKTRDGPVPFGPASEFALPDVLRERFGVQSQLTTATYPRTGKPWAFGMHQCAYARVWTHEEQRLFREINRRLADALSSMLMQRDLRKSEEFLDNVVENIPNMVFVKDAEALRFVRFNRAGEQLLGYPRDELLGKNDYDFFPKEEADFFTAKDREVLGKKGMVDIPEETISTRDGKERIVHTKKIPIVDSAGKPQYLLGISEDITERKQIEAVRTQLAAIVQSSHDAIIGKDLEGVITSWNPGAEKVYGYRAEEVLGRPVSVLAPEGRKDEITGLLGRVGRGEAVMNFETERFRKDGERIDVALDLSPIRDAAGRITGVSTIARDITEKKQAERALRKLNRALKALSSCNETLIHASDEMQLLNDICRIIVDIEGYRLAWVGYVEHDAQKTVRAVAQSGYDPGYMEHADITWADDERGRGPLGIAIRSGEVQVVQDVNTDPRYTRWRANAARLDYGSVLVAPLRSGAEVIGALSIHGESIDAFDPAEIALLGELAADMAFGIVTLRTRRAQDESAARLQHSMETTIQAIAGTVEMRDPYTAGHQRRVAELATAIARDLGLADDRVRGVHLAGVVHDLGKIHIPAEILSKPGKLSRLEFELIKSHPEAGYEILKGVDFPWPIAQIVYQHHERLDGSGYPRGLKAEEILLEARILAVADVAEAMSSHRPYRPSLGIELALQEIGENAGIRYDADVVRACLVLFREKAFAFKT